MPEAEQRREAAKQSLVRDVNDRISEVDSAFGSSGEREIVCECGRSDCTEMIQVSAVKYDDVRADPRRFLVVNGHESVASERIVERHSGWNVVETFGAAGDEAKRQA